MRKAIGIRFILTLYDSEKETTSYVSSKGASFQKCVENLFHNQGFRFSSEEKYGVCRYLSVPSVNKRGPKAIKASYPTEAEKPYNFPPGTRIIASGDDFNQGISWKIPESANWQGGPIPEEFIRKGRGRPEN